jgi:hypothetical protein
MDKRDESHVCSLNTSNSEPVNQPTEKKCQVCVLASTNGARFCTQCGRQLVEQENTEDVCTQKINSDAEVVMNKEVVDAPQVQSEQKSPDVSVKAQVVCEKPLRCSCGQDLPPEAKFCYRCGKELGKSLPNYRLILRSRGKADVIAKMPFDALTIGKNGDCDLIIADDEYVSRQHARLYHFDGQILLEDLCSSNGTFLRVKKPVALEIGDEFLIGTHLIRFENTSE